MNTSPHYAHVLTWIGAIILFAVTVYLFIKMMLRVDKNKRPKRQRGGSGNRARRRSERRLNRRKH